MAKVRLHEVAKKSGVSLQTVSRIINDRHDLHTPETVKRVLKAARELGYRPNLLARSMQRGKTQSVGVMVKLHRQSFGYDMLRGSHDELFFNNYLPIMLITGAGMTELDRIHRIVDRRVDGIILVPEERAVSDDYLTEILMRNIPLVTMNIEVPETHYADFVGTDDELGGRLAAEHLLSLGHTHLVFMPLPMSPQFNQKLRRKGFMEVVSQMSNVKCEIIDQPDKTTPYGYEDALRILKKKDRPTAIFTGSDRVARSVYRVAAELGLRIPEDLSVVGFSDSEFARHLIPPLTTLRQEPYEIGKLAAKMVIERIEGKVPNDKVPRRMRLKPELIIRDSTVPPSM